MNINYMDVGYGSSIESVHEDFTQLDSVRPLASAPCSELVIIDCNYTGIGDGTTPVGRTEAERSESMA